MKKFILILLLSLMVTTAHASLNPGTIPVTKTGGSNPVLQNGSITDNGTASGAANVGIGSTNPNYTLDVYGTIRSISNSSVLSGVLATNTNSAGEAIIQAKNDAGNSVYMGVNGSADGGSAGILSIGVTAGQTLSLGDSNNATMMSVVGGNVGIGSAIPISALDTGTGVITSPSIANDKVFNVKSYGAKGDGLHFQTASISSSSSAFSDLPPTYNSGTAYVLTNIVVSSGLYFDLFFGFGLWVSLLKTPSCTWRPRHWD